MSPVQMAKLLNRHSLADHEKLAHLLPSTKSMIIARKKNHIQGNHTTNRGPIDIPTQHSLAQHLAQAEGSRSGETCSLRRASPSPRREHKNKCVGNVGSRLSEIPLAWASCLLAQKPQQVAWATIRGEMLRRASVNLA
ncbi:hypothetical protein DEO72_LG7g1548 [Vigna unguiculata]|uniref:Uncharacterized protein n=1 Tax=Vigna unguiculata TaxID=3917 RepID=A0A4D6MFQ3_VIGUN|nr:hypothetical protein DEO72_LG7g1548 [Vigna unguiculata]